MITVKLKYPDGLNSQLDNQIFHLAKSWRGDFIGSGVTLATQERDMEFDFKFKTEGENFSARLAPFIKTTLEEKCPT